VPPVERAELKVSEGGQEVTIEHLPVALVALASERRGDPVDPAGGVARGREPGPDWRLATRPPREHLPQVPPTAADGTLGPLQPAARDSPVAERRPGRAAHR
jgi:hypothetical protein